MPCNRRKLVRPGHWFVVHAALCVLGYSGVPALAQSGPDIPTCGWLIAYLQGTEYPEAERYTITQCRDNNEAVVSSFTALVRDMAVTGSALNRVSAFQTTATGSVRLSWDPNPETDLAGYVLVWGRTSGVYTQSMTLGPSMTSHEVVALADGVWFFAIRAFNVAQLHSAYSNEVAVSISDVPSDIQIPAPLTGITAIRVEVGE